MRTIEMVATDAVIDAQFRDNCPSYPQRRPGIRSAEFAVDPGSCGTKFGRWLCERVSTTRRDDDLSRLIITLPGTEEDQHVKQMAMHLTSTHIRSAEEAERLFLDMTAWIERRRKFHAAYGESCFKARVVAFEWPVLGSAAAEKTEDPAVFFDLCAARIREMRPKRVRLWDGAEPPPSLNVVS